MADSSKGHRCYSLAVNHIIIVLLRLSSTRTYCQLDYFSLNFVASAQIQSPADLSDPGPPINQLTQQFTPL